MRVCLRLITFLLILKGLTSCQTFDAADLQDGTWVLMDSTKPTFVPEYLEFTDKAFIAQGDFGYIYAGKYVLRGDSLTLDFNKGHSITTAIEHLQQDTLVAFEGAMYVRQDWPGSHGSGQYALSSGQKFDIAGIASTRLVRTIILPEVYLFLYPSDNMGTALGFAGGRYHISDLPLLLHREHQHEARRMNIYILLHREASLCDLVLLYNILGHMYSTPLPLRLITDVEAFNKFGYVHDQIDIWVDDRLRMENTCSKSAKTPPPLPPHPHEYRDNYLSQGAKVIRIETSHDLHQLSTCTSGLYLVTVNSLLPIEDYIHIKQLTQNMASHYPATFKTEFEIMKR